MTRPAPHDGAAQRLFPLAEQLFGGRLPLRLRAWDGSVAGPDDAPTVVLRSRRALRRLVWQPNELGLAQAYITGELDIEGDLADGLRTVWRAVRERGLRPPKLPAGDRARAAA
ncbi:cyclopropane-fatty-acyl-phospholipid synthase, partial [Streptomyces sp. AcH 505]